MSMLRTKIAWILIICLGLSLPACFDSVDCSLYCEPNPPFMYISGIDSSRTYKYQDSSYTLLSDGDTLPIDEFSGFVIDFEFYNYFNYRGYTGISSSGIGGLYAEDCYCPETGSAGSEQYFTEFEVIALSDFSPGILTGDTISQYMFIAGSDRPVEDYLKYQYQIGHSNYAQIAVRPSNGLASWEPKPFKFAIYMKLNTGEIFWSESPTLYLYR